MNVQRGDKSNFIREKLTANPELTFDEILADWKKEGYDEEFGYTLYRSVKDKMLKKTAAAAPKAAGKAAAPKPAASVAATKAPESIVRQPAATVRAIHAAVDTIDAHIDEMMVACHDVEEMQDVVAELRKVRRLAYSKLD